MKAEAEIYARSLHGDHRLYWSRSLIETYRKIPEHQGRLHFFKTPYIVAVVFGTFMYLVWAFEKVG